MIITTRSYNDLPPLQLAIRPGKYDINDCDKEYPGLTRTRMNNLFNLYQPLIAKFKITLAGLPESLTDLLNRWSVGKYYGMIAPQKELFYRVLILPENIALAVKNQPAPVQTVFKIMAQNIIIDRSQIQSILTQNPNVMFPKRISLDSVGEIAVNSEYVLSLLSIYSGINSWAKEYFTLDPLWSKTVFETVLPNENKPAASTTDVLPDNSELALVSHEEEIISQASIIRQTSEMMPVVRPTNISQRIKATDAKRLSTGLKLSTVFPEKDAYYKSFMEKVLWSVYSRTPNEPQLKPTNPITWVREKFVNATSTFSLFQYVALGMPFVDKLYATLFDYLPADKFIGPINKILIKYAVPNKDSAKSDVWIEARSFESEVRSLFPFDNPFAINLTALSNYYVYNTAASVRILPSNAIFYYTIPFIRSILTIYLALGLVEVAFSKAAFMTKDMLSAIKFVRLTNLGRYVFGRDSEFVGKAVVEVTNKVETITELSEDRLMIFTNDKSLEELIKKNYGKRVTTGRYLVDDQSFMKGVTSVLALNSKIDDFKRLFNKNGKLPEIWTAFFHTLENRFNAIKASELDSKRLYDINDPSGRLFEIMRNDGEIRDIVRMVEGGGFLVAKNDITKLRTLLRKYGYSLPSPINPSTGYYYW